MFEGVFNMRADWCFIKMVNFCIDSYRWWSAVDVIDTWFCTTGDFITLDIEICLPPKKNEIIFAFLFFFWNNTNLVDLHNVFTFIKQKNVEISTISLKLWTKKVPRKKHQEIS